ncbi:MAG: hypothetical protein IKZ71_06010 [Bacteroidales bacterium]|nr:hypothetical protein [Bacteroidales bacterium]
MKQSLKFLVGLALIVAGVLWILHVLGILDFEFSTRGWWTLFIIVPSIFALFTQSDKVGPCIGIGLGVLLLLAARDIIDWSMMWQLGLAVMVIGFGFQLLFFKSCHSDPKIYESKNISRDGKDIRHINSCFGRQYLTFSGEKFDGAEVDTSFGSLTLDLRGAIIDNDVFIDVNVAFGGMVIIVPEGMAVRISVSSGFGGVSDNRRIKVLDGSPLVAISGKVAFGGLEIRN